MGKIRPVIFFFIVILLGLPFVGCNMPGQATPTTSTVIESATSLIAVKFESGSAMSWADGGQLVFVPGASFDMGDDQADNTSHEVTLSSYWIYRTKVTNEMYLLCLKVGICSPPADEDLRRALFNPGLEDVPVVGVDWDQAKLYCEWAQGHLPSEAQWELAARGTRGNIYPWGNDAPVCDLLNFENCTRALSNVENYPSGASEFGALDLAGNAQEWVFDWYAADYYLNSPAQDPLGPVDGNERVVRGSGYLSLEAKIPSSIRSQRDPKETDKDLGFRCVVENPTALSFAPYCETEYTPGISPPPAGASASSCFPTGAGFYSEVPECRGGSRIYIHSIGNVLDAARSRACVSEPEPGATDPTARVFTCSGAPNSTVQFTVCGSGCGVPGATASDPENRCGGGGHRPMQAGEESLDRGDGCVWAHERGNCPEGYVQEYNNCYYHLSPAELGGNCPEGTILNESYNVCTLDPTRRENPLALPAGEPACLAGFLYDSAGACCQSPSGFTPRPQNGSSGCNTFTRQLPRCGGQPGGDDGSGCPTGTHYSFACTCCVND